MPAGLGAQSRREADPGRTGRGRTRRSRRAASPRRVATPRRHAASRRRARQPRSGAIGEPVGPLARTACRVTTPQPDRAARSLAAPRRPGRTRRRPSRGGGRRTVMPRPGDRAPQPWETGLERRDSNDGVQPSRRPRSWLTPRSQPGHSPSRGGLLEAAYFLPFARPSVPTGECRRRRADSRTRRRAGKGGPTDGEGPGPARRGGRGRGAGTPPSVRPWPWKLGRRIGPLGTPRCEEGMRVRRPGLAVRAAGGNRSVARTGRPEAVDRPGIGARFPEARRRVGLRRSSVVTRTAVRRAGEPCRRGRWRAGLVVSRPISEPGGSRGSSGRLRPAAVRSDPPPRDSLSRFLVSSALFGPSTRSPSRDSRRRSLPRGGTERARCPTAGRRSVRSPCAGPAADAGVERARTPRDFSGLSPDDVPRLPGERPLGAEAVGRGTEAGTRLAVRARGRRPEPARYRVRHLRPGLPPVPISGAARPRSDRAAAPGWAVEPAEPVSPGAGLGHLRREIERVGPARLVSAGEPGTRPESGPVCLGAPGSGGGHEGAPCRLEVAGGDGIGERVGECARGRPVTASAEPHGRRSRRRRLAGSGWRWWPADRGVEFDLEVGRVGAGVGAVVPRRSLPIRAVGEKRSVEGEARGMPAVLGTSRVAAVRATPMFVGSWAWAVASQRESRQVATPRRGGGA